MWRGEEEGVSFPRGKAALPSKEVKTGVPHRSSVPSDSGNEVYGPGLGEVDQAAAIHQRHQRARSGTTTRVGRNRGEGIY
jgi:hypothetical protein